MSDIAEIITQATPYFGTALEIIGAAAVVARFTPTPIDNIVLVALKTFINFVAMNSGPAENLEVPGSPQTIKERKRRAAARKTPVGPRN